MANKTSQYTQYTGSYTPVLGCATTPAGANPKHLPSPGALENETTNHTSGHGQATHNGDSHQAFLGHLIINEGPQARGLQVGRFFLQEQIVVAPSLSVVP